MKTLIHASFVTLLGFLLSGGQALAAPEGDETSKRAELDKARAALSEAAQRVAELSKQIDGESGRIFIVADEMERRFNSDRPMLGVGIAVTDGDERNKGVSVVSVTPGGPADKAGIRSGDQLTKIDKISLEKGGDAAAEALTGYLETKKAGDEVTVTYLRGDDERTATVKTEAMQGGFMFRSGPNSAFFSSMPGVPPAPRAPEAPFMVRLMRSFGDIELVSMTEGLGRYFDTDKGLLVVRAPRDEAFKLEDGDVILSIDGREPENPGHAIRILSSYNGGDTLKLDIMRERKKRSIEVSIPEREIGFNWRLWQTPQGPVFW